MVSIRNLRGLACWLARGHAWQDDKLTSRRCRRCGVRKVSYFWDAAALPNGANGRGATATNRPNVRDKAWFARAIKAGDDTIRARNRENVTTILKNSMLLAAASKELSKPEFVELCRAQLEYSTQKVSHLLAIAKDDRIRKVDHDLLPPCWQTLYQLTRLTDEQFQQGLDGHVIRAEMQRRDVAKLRPPRRKESPEKSAFSFGPI